MKYIDADKLLTIIEERKAQQDQWINRYHDPINQGISHELTEILSIIDSLQQERPSLPSGLDDAAEKYSENILANNEDLQDAIEDAFKSGAEWMAGQGESHETEIVSRVTGNGLLPAVTCLVNKSYKEGDEVVVQIRKK